MENFDEQIKELYRLTDTVKRSELSEALGVSGSAVQNWRNRKKIPAHIILKAHKIHKERLNASKDNLNDEIPFDDDQQDWPGWDRPAIQYEETQYGDSDIEEQINELMSLTHSSSLSKLSSALDVSISEIQKWRCAKKIPDHILRKVNRMPPRVSSAPSGFLHLPFYDVEVSAGHGALVECEERSEDMAFSRNFVLNTLGVNARNIFLMPVRGDSMSPTLKNQSLIIVNRIDKLIEDGVYVFRYDGQLRVKRLQFSKNGITVVSDNPAYKTWELNKTELTTEDFEIIGEVIWAGQRM